jgi:hypothetical protein
MTVATQITREDALAGRLVVYADLAQCFYYPAKPLMDLLQGEMETRLPYYELLGLNPRPHFAYRPQAKTSLSPDNGTKNHEAIR